MFAQPDARVMNMRNVWMRNLMMGVVAVLVAVSMACGGSGGSDDGGSGGKVQVDLDIPQGKEYALRLNGPVAGEFSGSGTGRNQRAGETKFDVSGVSEACDNFTLLFILPITEGDTGTFDSVKTSQFTCKSTQYVSGKALKATVDTYSGGTISMTLVGDFDQSRSGDSTKPVSPPLKIEGKFAFEY